MTPSAENPRPETNPFADLWEAFQNRDGPRVRHIENRIEREFRSIERRLAKKGMT